MDVQGEDPGHPSFRFSRTLKLAFLNFDYLGAAGGKCLQIPTLLIVLQPRAWMLRWQREGVR